jgi:two-component system, cell cycle sensor histidine kinase and response regulator CckA
VNAPRSPRSISGRRALLSALLVNAGLATAMATATATAQGQGSGESPAAKSMWSVVPSGHQLQVYAERRFDAASGLRGSTVFAMQLDRNGIPWIGADDGLYAYAGGTWRNEPLPGVFANQQVRSLLMQANGSRWIGTRRGLLYRPRGTEWQIFGESEGLAGTVVFSLAESRAVDGTPRVVAGTSRGVSYYDGKRFIPLPIPAAMDPLGMMVADAVAPDGAAELWAASSQGALARLHNGQWTLYSAAEGLATPDVQFVLPVPGPDGGKIYVAGSAGVFVLDRAAGSPRFTAVPGSPRNAYRLEVVTSVGDVPELWVGLHNGEVHRLRDGRWRPLATTISERHGTITLLKAVAGHGGGTAVYASSRSGYLVRLSHGVAGSLSLPEVESASFVGAVYAERSPEGRDAVWVGTNNRGLLHVSGGGAVTRYPFAGGQQAGAASFIHRLSLAAPAAVAPTDSTLVVIADSLPWRLRGAQFERFDAGLGNDRVLHLARVTLPDGRNALLAGTLAGVRLWSGVRWEPLWPEVTGLVSAIAGGRAGSAPVVYLGGRHDVRVVRANGTSRESFSGTTMSGVGIGGVRRICTSEAAGQSRLFALDNDYGLLWRTAADGSWSPLPAHLARVMSNLGVTDITCLRDGQLAVSTFTGLAVFDLTAPTPDKWRVATQVSDADGLPANGVIAIAASATAPNVVWVGTTFGLGVVDLSRAAQLPPARLTMRVVAEERRRMVGQGDVLGPDENDLHVEPMLLTFHREELTRFRVRLTGKAEWPSPTADVQNDPIEGEWLDVPNRYYHDLAPGAYELTVWAYDWAGREYGPLQRTFSVLTPNWRTWPARIIYVLWVVLLLTVAYRWRVRTIRENALQLLDSERRARDSEGRFRAIFEQALDGHLLLEDGKVQAGNAVAARLFGVDHPSELDGRRLDELCGIAADKGAAAGSGECTIEADGRAVPVNFTVTDIPSADRVLRHIVMRDLTEVRKAEAERAWFQAQVREAQKLESLGTLAGGVAHDFNNLLGVIRGNAELARTALRRNRSNDDNLGAILDASDRARDIVRQILTFSRRSTPTREFVNLSRIVLDLQPLLRRMIPRTVQLVIEGAEDAHLIMGDPTQLQQLLLNLVPNAEYAMRNTTNGLLTIALSARTVPEGLPAPLGHNVVLQVRDTGAGMSEEVRSRIFEPFFTTKPTGEGTGLGMAVVHGIVTSHEGRADVISAIGQGTTFEIRFPQAVIADLWDDDLDPTALLDEENEGRIEPAGILERPRSEDDPADVLADSPYAGTTIVVVDDEPAVAQVVERALQHYGHVVHVFNNPEPALQFIREQPSSIDLLITDQTMPGMTGDLLAESVHALRSDLPVLILTGFSHRLTPERIAAARAHAVMLKPVELEQLKQRVDEALALTLRR